MAKKRFETGLELNGPELFGGAYIRKVYPRVWRGTSYNDLDPIFKDGTYHRLWRICFPVGANFWGRLKLTLYGGYSSFNASGLMSKTISCNFNGSNIYNNLGYYTELGLNIEKDFRISEAIWNPSESRWEILVKSVQLQGNNVFALLLEAWGSGSSYINYVNDVIVINTPEFNNDVTYTALLASINQSGNLVSKTVNWLDIPKFESPYGRQIWDSGNDGTESGLDADLLDGQHGAYYLDYNNFTNKPTSFPPSAHDHDDRYFTETESDARYALTGHNHDGVYEPVFSKNTAFNKNFGTIAGTVAEGNHTHAYSPTGHTHDDRYYTETESDARFAPIAHNHDDRYSMLGHTHDSRYYTETEINNLLANYQALDSDLTAIAALTGTGYLYRDAFTGWRLETISGGDSYTGWELNGSLIEGINAGNDKFRNVIIQGIGTDISVSAATGDSGTYWTKYINIQNTAPFPGFGTTSSTAARGNHTHTIDSLSNVTISSPATNSLLAYNGSAWVNKTASELGLGGGGGSYTWSLNSIPIPATDGITHSGVLLTAGTGMKVDVQDMRDANPAYVSAIVSAKRSFTWVIQNPTVGTGIYVLGPKIGEACTVTGISACVSSATSVTFNIQKRSAPNTAGTNIRSTNMTANTSGASFTPTSGAIAGNQYLVLMLVSKSGTPAQLAVTVYIE